MDYVIQTFGGGDILWQIFNGVGRVFASDSEYFTPVGKFALTIGGIWAGTRAIFKGNIGIFAMEWFFPSFFIFIFLFTPKATVWLKDEVSMNAPMKVDNIPIGLAFFSSISSRISVSVSEMLEKHLLPSDDGLSNRKTGIMFGAKAIGKIRDIQIQDPITLTNSKEFLRQCFMKPYIIGNILGKKGEAKKTNDIIGFIEQNMPNNFGIYYREPVNSAISFKTCKQATPLIKAAINKELHDGLLTKFASAIGIQSDRPEQLNYRLKVITSDTLKYLKKEQTDIHQWMKQAMLLNANRESYDDWREKFSLGRIYPQLVSMNATRGLFQQSFSYLVAGEMAASIMPILQSVSFAVVICMIFLVFPMSMLPGGFNTLKTWLLLIIWVASFPVFFTIIHCLGMISLAGMSNAFGEVGLNILSQGSFSEMLLHTYSTFQILTVLVPRLSWVVLKGCADYSTTLTSQFSPISVASGIGANIADNNISMDNYNIGNRTIAQQSFAPSLQMGSGIIDDGGMRVTNTDIGRQFITESVDSLISNFRYSQVWSDSLQGQFMTAQSKMGTLTNRSSELASQEERQLTSFSLKWAQGNSMIEGLSVNENQALKESILRGDTINENYGSSERKETATNSSTSLGLNTGIFNVSTGASANNSKVTSHDISATQQKAYNDALEKVKSAQKDNRISNASDEVKSLGKDLNSTWNEQQSVGQEIARTAQTMQQLTNQRNYVDSNSATIDRNMNEPVLQAIIAKNMPGITSKEQAARWASTHSQEARQIAQEVVGIDNPFPQNNWSDSQTQIKELQTLDSAITNIPMTTHEDLKNRYIASSQTMQDNATVTDSSGATKSLVESVKSDLNKGKNLYNQNVDEILDNQLSAEERAKVINLGTMTSDIDDNRNKLQDQFKQTSDSTIARTAEQIADNMGISEKAIKKRNIKFPLNNKKDNK
ncbi:MAG: conjugal transfer protein TraG N-terminal domain-containing protein [Rickettsia endosymbiont of Platyusa sonomae]|nr:conjugal transfer protein TraG N-terminal domain-containing protein [Rickettsia endosymbiont of Platyusa sonomae]